MRYLIILFSCWLLSGCASIIRSEVTAFHQWPTSPAAQSFGFVIGDASSQTLENQRYEQLISAELQKLGMSEALVAEQPQLLVSFKTSVHAREMRVIETILVDSWYGTPWYGPGFYYPYSSWPGYGPSLYGPGWVGRPRVQRLEHRYTVFDHELKLTITDAITKQSLYEGTVRSEDKQGNLTKMMPYLVSSLFVEFPGKSGVPQRIELKAAQ
jgi:hypothetical protein